MSYQNKLYLENFSAKLKAMPVKPAHKKLVDDFAQAILDYTQDKRIDYRFRLMIGVTEHHGVGFAASLTEKAIADHLQFKEVPRHVAKLLAQDMLKTMNEAKAEIYGEGPTR